MLRQKTRSFNFLLLKRDLLSLFILVFVLFHLFAFFFFSFIISMENRLILFISLMTLSILLVLISYMISSTSQTCSDRIISVPHCTD